MSKKTNFDVIIVGGGHAGCEAAHAAAKMGCQTLLVTLDPKRIGVLSCNPAVGGLAKGQLVREIDALGGIMGRIADRATLQNRKLNSSKGPAVRSTRAQCDQMIYQQRMQEFLSSLKNLTILSGEVVDFLLDHASCEKKISGLVLSDGSEIRSKSVVITSGTFLRALMFTGRASQPGGRIGDQGANQLSQKLESLGFSLRRLKTGTPPRLRKSSLNLDALEIQWGDLHPTPFSFYQDASKFPELPQLPCWITYTHEKTHEIIERNFHQSPMFTGMIQGVGPRYCPSIEDKVKRFRDKSRHQIFLEPESLSTEEIYVNGTSTSLPQEVQEQFIHSIPGLEQAQFIRYGYAVEYDAVDARQLKLTFESHLIQGLFFAGQVNGTSGYEEAGAQGIIAGINAALLVQEKDPFVMSRTDSYCGVLADDLVLKGSDEPYRMFTSRAEYRLVLREDNADLRLSELGYQLGLLSPEDYQVFEQKREAILKLGKDVKSFSVEPSPLSNALLIERGFTPLSEKISGAELLKRPEIGLNDLENLGLESQDSPSVKEQVEIQVKYQGYIQRELDFVESTRKNEALKIPHNLDYDSVSGLSHEIRGKLRLAKPENLGQFARLQGVTPAAVAQLMIHLKQKSSRRSFESQA